jgi:hypothetical protein
MQQASQDVASLNNAIRTVPLVRDRCLLLQSLVRARFIVEGNVFDQNAAQMALIEDQNAIETLLA